LLGHDALDFFHRAVARVPVHEDHLQVRAHLGHPLHRRANVSALVTAGDHDRDRAILAPHLGGDARHEVGGEAQVSNPGEIGHEAVQESREQRDAPGEEEALAHRDHLEPVQRE